MKSPPNWKNWGAASADARIVMSPVSRRVYVTCIGRPGLSFVDDVGGTMWTKYVSPSASSRGFGSVSTGGRETRPASEGREHGGTPRAELPGV